MGLGRDIAISITLAASPLAAHAVPATGRVALQPGQRVLATGERLDLDVGTLLVPAHHGRAGGHPIAIAFERYRARHPSHAAPIFLLAGGPGDSALDRLTIRRGQEDLSFFTQFADVVVFDQRGAGHSMPRMTCPDTVALPLDTPSSAAARVAAMRRIATACRTYWIARGVDLSAYTTPESGDDVDALRRALGYGRINLIGGSYGSHLGMSLMRRHPEMIDRVILRGIEGPDDTYDMPSGTLGALKRIAADAEAAPELAGAIPPGGLIAALEAVEQRLDHVPVRVTVDGKTIMLGGDDVRLAVKYGARRDGRWPAFVIEMYRGDYRRLAELALATRTVRIENPMYYMMDCASGLTAARRSAILADPAQRVLGDINEEYFATCDIWRSPDLGATFRSPLRSAIPTLMFQGTWDVSTPLENADQAAATLANVAYARVAGGTHPVIDDLFQSWAPMRDTMRRFLEGGRPAVPARIALPRVIFEQPRDTDARRRATGGETK